MQKPNIFASEVVFMLFHEFEYLKEFRVRVHNNVNKSIHIFINSEKSNAQLLLIIQYLVVTKVWNVFPKLFYNTAK